MSFDILASLELMSFDILASTKEMPSRTPETIGFGVTKSDSSPLAVTGDEFAASAAAAADDDDKCANDRFLHDESADDICVDDKLSLVFMFVHTMKPFDIECSE